jgi:AcrR family transcriptional regulator
MWGTIVTTGGLSGAPLRDFRLTAGRRDLSREEVEESQQWRLMVAAAQVFAEHGYEQTRSGDVARRAHVSRATFYEHFDNIDDCLLAAYEMAAECLLDIVEVARQGPGSPDDRVRRAVEDVLAFLAVEPVLARLLGVEAAAGVRAIAEARERMVANLADLLAGGPEIASGAGRLLLDGAFALIAATPPEQLPSLAPELAQILTASRRDDA